jgi:hypothetical protein
MPRRARLTTTSVVASACVVAVAAFGLGFVASYDSGSGTELATATSTTDATGESTTTSTEAPRSTTSTVATTSTSLPTTTLLLPTTTLPLVTTTGVPSTVATTSTAPPQPGAFTVSYPRNAAGLMVIRPGRSSSVVLQNVGSTAAGFRVQTSGAVTVTGSNDLQGTIGPGQALTLPIVASANPPPGPGPHGTVGIFNDLGIIANISVIVRE